MTGLEAEIARVSGRQLIATDDDDASKGIRDLVIMALTTGLEQRCANLVVSLKLHHDQRSMCGGCRVNVENDTKFACNDGPEFGSPLLGVDVLMNRERKYSGEQKTSCQMWKQQHSGIQ